MYAGTHMVSSGPLAAGSVSMGGSNVLSKTGLTSDRVYTSSLADRDDNPLMDLIKNRKATLPSKEDIDSDDGEDDPTKINMSKEYIFDEVETALFPVRPQKDAVSDQEVIQISATPLIAPSRAQSVEVKSESTDEVGASVESSGVDPAEAEELQKRATDQFAIRELMLNFQSLSTGDDNFFLLHMPQILAAGDRAGDLADLNGHVGKLNFHKSGKVTMSIGNSVFEVSRGASAKLLQEVAVTTIKNSDSSDTDDMQLLDAEGRKVAGKIHSLGYISEKLVATPIL